MFANLNTIKKELIECEKKQLIEIITRLCRFKLDNKSLVSFLLFDAENEPEFVKEAKLQIDDLIEESKYFNFYSTKKRYRKIATLITKYVKFTNKTESEIELRLHLVKTFTENKSELKTYLYFKKALSKQLEKVDKLMKKIHEDLQFEYEEEINNLNKILQW